MGLNKSQNDSSAHGMGASGKKQHVCVYVTQNCFITVIPPIIETNWLVWLLVNIHLPKARFLKIHGRGLLVNVFLMVFFCSVKIRCRLNTDPRSHSSTCFYRRFCQLLLLLGVIKDGRSILGSRKAGIRRRSKGERHYQEFLVANFLGIEDHANAFRVILNILVRGINCRIILGSGVPNYRFENALNVDLIEVALRAPESSHGSLEGSRGVGNGIQEGADIGPSGGRKRPEATVPHSRSCQGRRGCQMWLQSLASGDESVAARDTKRQE